MLKLKLISRETAPVGKKSRRRPTRTKSVTRPCNLCGDIFVARTAQCCFCEDCKQEDELYRFHDWLPDQLSVA